MHAYAKQFGQDWVGVDRLDSLTIQKIATRAFRAVQEYHFSAKGKPRFKGKGSFDSVEGKTNTSGIRWQAEKKTVAWLGLTLPTIIDPTDKVIEHGSTCRVKFVRIVRRKLNRRIRFYAQLVCEGRPYQKAKNTLGQGVTGIDIGPSTIAMVSEETATLEKFCEELEPNSPPFASCNANSTASGERATRRTTTKTARSSRASSWNGTSRGATSIPASRWSNCTGSRLPTEEFAWPQGQPRFSDWATSSKWKVSPTGPFNACSASR